METEQPTPRSPQIENAQRLLAEQGHDLGVFGMRVAAGRSGVAVGFPQDPLVHVSWFVLGGLVLLAVVARRAALLKPTTGSNPQRLLRR